MLIQSILFAPLLAANSSSLYISIALIRSSELTPPQRTRKQAEKKLYDRIVVINNNWNTEIIDYTV